MEELNADIPEEVVANTEQDKDEETEANDTPETPKMITILEATLGLSREIRKIAKITRMDDSQVMAIYSFFYQQEEAARIRRENEIQQLNMIDGQAQIDRIATEEAAKAVANEVITADDEDIDE